MKYSLFFLLLFAGAMPVLAKRNVVSIPIEIEDSSFGLPDYLTYCKTPDLPKEVVLTRMKSATDAKVSKTLTNVEFTCRFKFEDEKMADLVCPKVVVPMKDGAPTCSVLLELSEDTFSRKVFCKPECSTR